MLRFCSSADYFPFPFFSYAHRRYALNGHLCVTCLRFAYLSRAVGPLTRTSPFPFHVFPYLYYYGPSTRLRLHFLFTFTSFGPSTRLQSRYSWTLTRTMTRLSFMTLCTCISQSDIYTIGDGDLSLIFNLLCNHPTSVKCKIPHNSPPPF